jgi:hypothetical protein
MTGLEALVLVPFVYGCVHLGKKVLDQSRVIDNQNALIDVQRDTISALQTLPGTQSGGREGSRLWQGRAATFSGVAIAASLLAYNTHRWLSETSARAASDAAQQQLHEPSDTYIPTAATSEQDECKICCEHQRDTILLPCRHFALCWGCATRIRDSEDSICPICRAEIAGAQFTYVS